MLLLLDVGNTSVTYGISLHNDHLSTFSSCLYDDIPKLVKKCSQSGRKYNVLIMVASCVVPHISKKLTDLAKKYDAKLLLVGKNLSIPMKNRYKSKKKLGIDRLVNLYGALKRYKAPLLMIDFGTAITFDYVSKANAFEGGMIIPGPEVSFQALLKRAALLPKDLRLPEKSASFLGKTTYDCMASGILEGYGAMTEGLIQRFQARYGKDLKVIATGGFTHHLKRYCKSVQIWDAQHSIKSLLQLYKATA